MVVNVTNQRSQLQLFNSDNQYNWDQRVATDLLQQILVTFTGDMAEREIKEMMTVMKGDKEGKKDYVYVYVGNYRGVCCSANLP